MTTNDDDDVFVLRRWNINRKTVKEVGWKTMNDDRRAQRIHTCGETFGVAYTVVSSAIFHHFSTTYIDRLLCLVK